MLQLKVRIAGLLGAMFAWSCLLCAAPALTTIQDVLYKADGTRFNGILQITWRSFQAGDTTNVPTQSVTTQVTGGYLRVQLVPTTNAATPANYSVTYNSDGKIQFTETWAVPPSSTTLRVSDVRVPAVGSPLTGGGTSTPVQITDVTGLTSALAIRPTLGPSYMPSRSAVIDANGSLAAAVGNLSDCLHVDGTAGPCATSGTSGPAFADAEMPSGTVDGVNGTFQLLAPPAPASSLGLFRNGLMVTQNSDYTISGSTITFLPGSIPQPGDVLEAFYRTSPPVSLPPGTLIASPCMLQAGNGSPNGLVTGSPCDIYLNTSGGANSTLWVKESGISTNTGWVGK